MSYFDEPYGGDHLAEHNDFHYSTDAEWDHAEALELGELNENQCWILTDRDVWHRNPFYQGVETPHPEDHCGDEEWEDAKWSAWADANFLYEQGYDVDTAKFLSSTH